MMGQLSLWSDPREQVARDFIAKRMEQHPSLTTEWWSKCFDEYYCGFRKEFGFSFFPSKAVFMFGEIGNRDETYTFTRREFMRIVREMLS